MHLLASMSKYMLLDSNKSTPSNENINKFGFNTSVTQNVPESMTPVAKKKMDFDDKYEKIQSVENNKENSFTNDDMSLSQIPNISHPVLNTSVLSDNMNNHILPSIDDSIAYTTDDNDNNNVTNPTNESNEVAENPMTGIAKTGNINAVNENKVSSPTNILNSKDCASSSITTLISSTSILTSRNNNIIMTPPLSSMLRIGLFQDIEQNSPFRRVDRKPVRLKELDMLLFI